MDLTISTEEAKEIENLGNEKDTRPDTRKRKLDDTQAK